MTQAFTVFLEELWLLGEAKIGGQEANVEQKQESIHLTRAETIPRVTQVTRMQKIIEANYGPRGIVLSIF